MTMNNHVEAEEAAMKQPTFYAKNLQIEMASPDQMRQKPENASDLKFGQVFSDHMIEVDWTEARGWERPRICALRNFQFHPAAKIFHYAPSVFEGMKAFRGVDGKIRIFRPEMNMARMRRAAARAALPDFEPEQLLALIMELVRIDADWVPRSDAASLYIRPALMATDPTLELSNPKSAKLFVITGPVGAYFPSGLKPITVLADPQVARAFPGGVGGFKMASNYGPTILHSKLAVEKYGCHQVLWLFGKDEWLTEVGVMNIFVFWRNEMGELELVTPPTVDGLILDGIVRDSLLAIAREWGEFAVVERYPTMPEMRKAIAEGRILQVFGSGTACAVCPIDTIVYKPQGNGIQQQEELEVMTIPTTSDSKGNLMERFYKTITDIQQGRTGYKAREWARIVDE